MTTFLDMVKRLKSIDVSQIAETSVDITSPAISQLNREQLEEGFNSEGGRLRKYRNPVYARKKQSMNPKPGLGNPDLKLTGAYHRSIRADVDGQNIRIYSLDSKAPDLEKKYGDDIYGLGDEKKGEYVDNHLHPTFQREVRDKLKL